MPGPAEHPPTHMDEPILADFLSSGEALAVRTAAAGDPSAGRGGGRDPVDLPGSETLAEERGANRSQPSKAEQPSRSQTSEADPVSRQQKEKPLQLGAHRERRLVAVALRPAEALHRVPPLRQETATRRSPPQGVEQQLRQPLPLASFFRPALPTEEATARKRIRNPQPLSAPAGLAVPNTSAAANHGGEADAKRSGVHRHDDVPDSPRTSSRSPSQSASRAQLPRAARVSQDMRKLLCNAIFTEFLRTQNAELCGQKASDSQPVTFLHRWEAQTATSHCAAGDVGRLLLHLAVTELHLKHGPERRHMLSSAIQAAGKSRPPRTRIDFQALHAERHDIAAERSLQVIGGMESVLFRKYLDGELTWRVAVSFLRRRSEASSVSRSGNAAKAESDNLAGSGAGACKAFDTDRSTSPGSRPSSAVGSTRTSPSRSPPACELRQELETLPTVGAGGDRSHAARHARSDSIWASGVAEEATGKDVE